MNDGNDFMFADQGHRRNKNAGFKVGFVGGIVMWAIHIFMLLLFGNTNYGDTIAWFIQLFVYLLIGKSAAQKQYEAQRDDVDALRGVRGAGTGAALVTSVLSWVFIILRGFVRDAFGITIIINPVGLFCLIIVDVLLALALGTWMGKSVEKKYQT